MKIDKLRLKGFIGIQRGLGLEEITIDFANTSGLVAFDGMNGAGKSTVLENLHPYNTLASRSGALYNHVGTRDAEKELSFTYQGDSYKTLLKIDCQSGKSEGFIWKNGNSEVNGKISAYAKYITELLGSENMFFHSVFCAQNATKLSDMSTGQLKTLLSEFLNLDKLAEYEASAKEKITSTAGQVEQVEKRLAVLNDKLSGYEDIKQNIETAKAQLTGCEVSLGGLKEKRTGCTETLETLRASQSKQEVLIAQKANVEGKITELNARLETERTENETQLNAMRETYKKLQTEISKNEGLLKQADEITDASDREKNIQTAIELTSAQLERHTAETTFRLEAFNNNKAELDLANIAITQIKYDLEKCSKDPVIQQINNAIDKAQSQVLILAKRDAACQSSTCSFIVAALKAETELPKLHASLATRQIEVTRMSKALDSSLVDHERKVAALKEKNTTLSQAVATSDKAATSARKELASFRHDLAKVKELAGKITELEVAKTQYDNVTAQMEENKKQGIEARDKWHVRQQDIIVLITAQRLELEGIESQIDKGITVKINEIKGNISSIEKAIAETETTLNASRATIMKFEADLSARDVVITDFKAAEQEKSRLQADISDWTYLRNACGKNGLQAMEIDGAAPIITGYANDLLTQAFGPIFTVKFRTINDDGKECLDIIIINGDGEEVLLDNLSGGQKIWNLIALRQGMTLLSKEKSGKNFGSFFADELDGPLDPDNAVNFISMYRSFMKSGGFQDGYFISHKPECRSLADHVLMFETGKNPVWQ